MIDKVRHAGYNESWVSTYSGKKFHLLDPKPEEIDINDIARGLSMTCRYNGQIDRFYSVAEHSVLMAQAILRDGYRILGRIVDVHRAAFEALMHDASEAYLGDVVSPLKKLLPDYRAIEDRVTRCIETRFNIHPDSISTDVVKSYDRLILFNEVQALCPATPEDWHRQYYPGLQDTMILGWSPEEARTRFLSEFFAHRTVEQTMVE